MKKSNKFKRKIISSGLMMLSSLMLTSCTENKLKSSDLNNETSIIDENNILLYTKEPYQKEKIGLLSYYYDNQFYQLVVYELDKTDSQILYTAINNPKIAVIGTFNGEDGYDFITLIDIGDRIYQTGNCYIEDNIQKTLIETFGSSNEFMKEQIIYIEQLENEESLKR